MTTIELAKLVKEMRAAQSIYFRTRTTEALEKAKEMEKKLDEAVHSILNPTIQSSLDI